MTEVAAPDTALLVTSPLPAARRSATRRSARRSAAVRTSRKHNFSARRTFALVVGAIEFAALAGGVAVAQSWGDGVAALAITAVLLLAWPAVGHLQWRFAPSSLDELPRAVALITGAALVTGVGLVLIGSGANAQQDLFAAGRAGAMLLACSVFGRSLAFGVVRRLRASGIGLANSAIVGSGEQSMQLAWTLSDQIRYGVRLVGVLDDDATQSSRPAPRLGMIRSLADVVQRHQLETVIIAHDKGVCETVVEPLRELCRDRCDVYLVPSLFPLRGLGTRAEVVGGLPLVPLQRRAFRAWSWPLKRAMDIAAALVGLLLAGPLMAAVALAVVKESGRGFIFKQQRIGLDGEPFTLYKFRSLKPAAGEGDTRWNIDGDPRLGPVGKFIRATSIDELPQLVNILKGDMSLVGPRPERPFFVERFSPTVPGYRHRHRVPVGLTGYAVVNGLKGDTSIDDRARYDNLYAESWSLWLDLKILLRTAAQLFHHS